MPEAVREVLIKWDYQRDVMARKLSIRRRAILEEYFGHRVNASMCLFHSQFGGVPTKNWWGQETATCPNKDCPDGPNRKMSFLAGVLNDPLGGLPMVESAKEAAKGSWNFFVGVEFQICGKCYTIRACNRGE